MKNKVRLGVLFGGRSEEHEVSVSSAQAVIAAVDKDTYEVVPIGITKTGKWLLGTWPDMLPGSEVVPGSSSVVELVADVSRQGLVPAIRDDGQLGGTLVDVIFPSSMDLTAKTGRYRDCSNSRGSPTSGPVSHRPRLAWTRPS